MNLDELKALKEEIDKLFKETTKEIDKLRNLKKDIILMRNEIKLTQSVGKVVNDPTRLVLSAPEVVIGDVDSYGVARNDGRLVLRAGSISIEATNEVTIRAPRIKTVAVNPGPDGEEDCLDSVSSITMQARSIAMDADMAPNMKFFPSAPIQSVPGTITLSATSGINFNADNTNKKSMAENIKKKSETESQKAKKTAEEAQKKLENLFKIYYKSGLPNPLANLGDVAKLMKAIGSEPDYETPQEKWEKNEQVLQEIKTNIDTYLRSTLAYKSETIRAENMGEYKEPDKKKDMPFVNMQAGQVRVNGGTDISMYAANIKMAAFAKDSKNGHIALNAENIELNTALQTTENDKTVIAPQGSVSVVTKTMNINAMKAEAENNTVKNTELIKDSKLNIAVETVNISTNDHEGKGKGKVVVTSKETILQAEDMDKEGKPATLTANSSIIATAKKVAIGGENNDEKKMADEVKIEAKAIKAIGQESVDITQKGKDATATLSVKGQAFTLKGDKLESETKDATIKANIKLNGEVEATNSVKVSKDVNATGKVVATGDVEGMNVKAKVNVEATMVQAKASVKTPLVTQ